MYFGPFPNGSALQGTLEFILRRFKLRSCKYDEPDEETIKRCMKRAVKDCSAPCCGKISPEDYRKKVEEALEVLKGNTKELCAELDEEMKQAASELMGTIRDIDGVNTVTFVSKEEAQAREINTLVEEKFQGSLPAFVAAFTKRQTLSDEELDEVQRMIDRIRKGESE